MLLGHVQDMVRQFEANRRERKPRSKKEKILDLLRTDRNRRPAHGKEFPPETVERIKAQIRENARRERRKRRIIVWIVTILALGAAGYLIISYMNYEPTYNDEFEFIIDENNRLRRNIKTAPF